MVQYEPKHGYEAVAMRATFTHRQVRLMEVRYLLMISGQAHRHLATKPTTPDENGGDLLEIRVHELPKMLRIQGTIFSRIVGSVTQGDI